MIQKRKKILIYTMFFLHSIFLLGKPLEEGIVELIINNFHRERSFLVYLEKGKEPWIDLDEFFYVIGIKNYEITSSGFNFKLNGEQRKSNIKIREYEGVNLISVEDIEKSSSEIKIEWDPDTFILKMDLPYELPKEFLISQSRKRDILDRKDEEDDLITEKWKAFTPGVLKIGYGKSDLSKGGEATTFNYINQLAYGASEINITGNDDDFDVDTYRWKRHTESEREIVIGDSYTRTPSDLGDTGSFRGLSIFKRNSWDTSMNVDSKSITGFASNGDTAELYENGLLREYQIVRNGRYEFEIETTGGNKSYEVWIYKEDGEIEKKPVSIYGSVDILDAGETDFELQIGQDADNTDFNPYNVNIFYGVTEDFTLKIGGYNANKDSQEENYVNISPTLRIGTTGTWSHLVTGDYSQNTSEEEQKYQRGELRSSNSTITNTFGFERYRGFEMDFINESYDEKQYWRVDFPFMDINTSLSYERERKSDTLEKTDRYGMTMYDSFFRGKVSASASLERERYSKEMSSSEYTTETGLGLSYNISNKSLIKILDTVGVEYDSESSQSSTYGIYFRRRSKMNRSLDYYLSIKKEDGQSFGELSVTYKLGDKLNIRSINYRDQNGDTRNGVELNTAINFGAPKEEKIYYTDYMGDSNVAGQVFIDTDNDGIMGENEKGLSDFQIKGNARSWKSGEDGTFFMPLISSSTHHRLDIKSMNTDILNYDYAKKYNIRTLPGGELQLFIPVVPLKSMVGIIEFDEEMYIEEIKDFFKNTIIKVSSENGIEETIDLKDEYFMKDLPVGNYSMEFLTTDEIEADTSIYKFEISSDEDEFEEYVDISIGLSKEKGYMIEVYQ